MIKKDKLTIRAKKEGLRARSAYKLLEINKKYKIIKFRFDVLDLGSWPGGWLIVSKKASKTGYVLGVDTKPIDSIPGCNFIKADIYLEDIIEKIKQKNPSFNVVLSDLAPKTTGIKELDRERSKDLGFQALKIAEQVLKVNGNFLCKFFQSEEQKKLFIKMKTKFNIIKIVKPPSSKKRSVEIYLLGIGFKATT